VIGKGDTVGAFAWWCVAGVGFAFGVLAVFTIGPFLLLGTFVLCAVLLWRLDFGWGMAGLLSGAALPVLLVAWTNRHGPGTYCTSDALSTQCTDEWSPWPFVAIAILLVVAGVVIFVRGRRD
jgi:hypothetical protein